MHTIETDYENPKKDKFSKYLKSEKWFDKLYLSILKLEKDEEGGNFCFSYCHSQICIKLLKKTAKGKIGQLFSYQLQYLYFPCYSEIILFQPHHPLQI